MHVNAKTAANSCQDLWFVMVSPLSDQHILDESHHTRSSGRDNRTLHVCEEYRLSGLRPLPINWVVAFTKPYSQLAGVRRCVVTHARHFYALGSKPTTHEEASG